MIRMKYVAYYRVSTKKQGRSGLGLEAQRACVTSAVDGELIAEFTEVESGKRRDRPELMKAVEYCKAHGAELIIAKLDRLSRDVSFIFTLREQGVQFRACDLPEFNTLTLGIFATVAQYEREKISERTKAALQMKLQRDGVWQNVSGLTNEGRIEGVKAIIQKAKDNPNNKRAKAFIRAYMQSHSLQAIADMLNDNGYRTAKDKRFSRVQVMRLIAKIKVEECE